jgi:hypothetical protein
MRSASDFVQTKISSGARGAVIPGLHSIQPLAVMANLDEE